MATVDKAHLAVVAVYRLGLTQELGPAREEGTIPLPSPVIVPIFWYDFTKSQLQTYRTSS